MILQSVLSLSGETGHDVSLIGFDDTDIRSVMYPKATAICQDTRRLGLAAFEHVAALAAGEAPEDKPASVHGAWLGINETTAPPPEVAFHVSPNRTRLAASRKPPADQS